MVSSLANNLLVHAEKGEVHLDSEEFKEIEKEYLTLKEEVKNPVPNYKKIFL